MRKYDSLLTFQIPENEKNRLQEIAENKNLHTSEYIREVLRKEIKRNEKQNILDLEV